jgi:RNA polymerase sigma-70 factor (ECF subfamily)
MPSSIITAPPANAQARVADVPHKADTGATDWAELSLTLRRFLVARTGAPQLAEDIAQETLLRLVAYQRENVVGSTYALAFRIARNLLCEQGRRHRPMDSIDDVDVPSDGAGPDGLLEQRGEIAAALAAIRAMPTLRREVFVRRRLRGESCAQIANDLNLSHKAVEKHITRALLDLDRLRGGDDSARGAR